MVAGWMGCKTWIWETRVQILLAQKILGPVRLGPLWFALWSWQLLLLNCLSDQKSSHQFFQSYFSDVTRNMKYERANKVRRRFLVFMAKLFSLLLEGKKFKRFFWAKAKRRRRCPKKLKFYNVVQMQEKKSRDETKIMMTDLIWQKMERMGGIKVSHSTVEKRLCLSCNVDRAGTGLDFLRASSLFGLCASSSY